jgi:nucleotide-binding universal stress UspA family protein
VFKNILVAVDGSTASTHALEMAIQISGKFDADLHLLHVVREMQLPLNPGLMDQYEAVQRQRHDLLRSSGEQILNQAKRVAQSKGVDSVKSDISSGDPATAIVDYAEKKQIALIVIGNRGLGQVQSMLMGSVSRKVSNITEAACLIVK